MTTSIKDVYAELIRRIAADKSLQKAVLIEAIFSGDYSVGNRNERGVEICSSSDAPNKQNLGDLIYRGSDKGRHAFYFVPAENLKKLDNEKIVGLTDTVKSNEDLRNLEVTLNHFSWPPLLEEDKEVQRRNLERLYKSYEPSERKKTGRKKKEVVRKETEEQKPDNNNTTRTVRIRPLEIASKRPGIKTEEERREVEKRLRKAGKLV